MNRLMILAALGAVSLPSMAQAQATYTLPSICNPNVLGDCQRAAPILRVGPTGAATPIGTATDPIYTSGGGSSGGPATIADGADTSEGATTAPAYTDTTGAAAGTVNGLNKGEFIQLYGVRQGLVGIATAANQTATGASAQTVQGADAVNTAVTARPVGIGGIYNSSPSGVTTGNRTNLLTNPIGAVVIAADVNGATTFDGVNVFTGLQSKSQTSSGSGLYPLATANGVFNSVTAAWYASRGDVTGPWVGGHANIATNQVVVGTTATLIAAARTGRQHIGVTVTSATQCAFGGPSVTLANGWPLAAVAYVSDSWDTNAALYAVCAATATVGYREQY